MYKQDLVINNPHRFICHKIQPTRLLVIIQGNSANVNSNKKTYSENFDMFNINIFSQGSKLKNKRSVSLISRLTLYILFFYN